MICLQWAEPLSGSWHKGRTRRCTRHLIQHGVWRLSFISTVYISNNSVVATGPHCDILWIHKSPICGLIRGISIIFLNFLKSGLWQEVLGFDLSYFSYLDDRVTPEICKIYMHFDWTSNNGKKAQVWKSANFDAGLYDITNFWWTLIISIYLELTLSWDNGKWS